MALMATVDELLSDALRLPPEERARLAHELLLSLEAEGEDSNAEAEWARELQRRAQEVTGGKVKLVSPEEARRQVAEHLERLRRER
jgi:putative addiction module component (TIGR02574 family)